MNSKPFIVAEISANHHGSFDRCIAIIDAAKDAGANAVKLQTYHPDQMVADKSYVIDQGPWKGQTLYELYQKAHTPWDWHPDIFNYCRHLGIVCFSTPFHESAVDYLETMGNPIYKVASFEITDLNLIKCITRTGKPIVMSTGMATKEEILEAVRTARAGKSQEITLLKCTSAYPASARDANLETMMDLSYLMKCPVGVSDHSPGIGVPITAALLGATFIEKHLTLDDEEGPDSAFSLRPHEFSQMVTEIHRAKDSLGYIHYGPTSSEKDSMLYRRSWYATQDIHPEETFNQANAGLRRPALGLSSMVPVHGQRAAHMIPSGTLLKPEDFI